MKTADLIKLLEEAANNIKDYEYEWLIDDLLAAAKALLAQDEWVKISDRMPTEKDGDSDGKVWVYDTVIRNVYRVAKSLVIHGPETNGLSHWKRTNLVRPQAPKTGDGK